MTPGTICLDKNFVFHDGQKGEKFFIVLSHGEKGHYIVSKTTSNGTRYGIKYGCQSQDRFPSFFLPSGSSCFPIHTWVCLHEFYEFSRQAVLEKHFRGTIVRFGVLTNKITEELLSCVAGCNDVSMFQRALISETLRILQMPN